MKNSPLNETMRLSIICDCIKYDPQPTKEKIRAEIVKRNTRDINPYISNSQIEKDIFKLRKEYAAPIVFSKKSLTYIFTEKYNFWKQVFLQLHEQVTLPAEIHAATLKLD